MLRHLLPCLLALCLCAPAHAANDADIVATRVAQFKTSLADQHPRLLLRPADLPALRDYLRTALPAEPQGEALARLALPPLDGRALIPQPEAVKNGSVDGSRRWREGYQAASEAGTWAQRYALAWLISEDPAYGREAARWLLHLASWRIDRDTYRSNDELFIQHLRPMIFAYDWAWHALSAEERRIVSAALAQRLTVLAAQVQPKFRLTAPTPPDNSLSHPMRFISTLGQGGQALFHEHAAAADWLAWSYEYYQRQFPVWGGPAGGWAEGLNYWGTGLTQHLRFLEGMALLGHGEPLARPFWRNTAYFAVYNQMPYVSSSFGDLNNLVRPNGSVALLLEKLGLLSQDPYPASFARAMAQPLPTNFGYYNHDGIDSLLHRFRAAQARLPEARLTELPQSRHFDDVGLVAMHSALGNAAEDIMFGLRASPLGTASHAFSDQNSFVINAFGEPLAISSGYREFYGSAHHVGWSRQTRSKNAVLFGGEGQRVRDASATARVLRFVDLPAASFVSGDALAAYQPHATRALRHVFFVERRYFVMLDELAAPEAVNYQWLLHARKRMTLEPARGEVLQKMGDARLRVSFLQPAASGLRFSQTDASTPPVEPGYAQKMPNEWHVQAETLAPAASQEFLTVLQPWQAQGSTPATPARIAAARGYALQLQTGDREETVLIAREAEQRAEAAGWALQGQAASFVREGEKLRFTLIASRALQGPLSLSSSQALNLSGEMDAQHLRLTVDAPGETSLLLPAGWQPDAAASREADGRLRITLPAGRSQLALRAAGLR